MGAQIPPLPPAGHSQEPEEPPGNVIAEGPPLHRTPSWWINALDPASFEKALANTSGIREAILGTVTKHNAQPRRRCPYCGRHNRPGPDTCPGCGATTEEA